MDTSSVGNDAAMLQIAVMSVKLATDFTPIC